MITPVDTTTTTTTTDTTTTADNTTHNTWTPSRLFLRQLFEAQSSTYSYLLADLVDRSAVIIDCVENMFERDCKLIKELGLEVCIEDSLCINM